MSGPAERVERFGDYTLTRYLTAGGMADLYVAESRRYPEPLVIKRIQARYAEHPRVVKMFIDEGRIASLLRHPNIARVVDVGEIDGQHYIAMEYIPGQDLIAIARRGIETGRFVPRPLAVALMAQVSSALAYAHSYCDDAGWPLRIVHCDVSPGNIVVSTRGTAKLVDFGIARAKIALREVDGVVGKYSYMAPEQIRGGSVDARADLFSLGVILYELTVGKRLFKGRPEVVMHRVCEEPIPPPTAVRTRFPEELERIVMKLLARDPDQRYWTAHELRDDLRKYLLDEEPGWGKREVARYLRELFHDGKTPLAWDEAAIEIDADDEPELPPPVLPEAYQPPTGAPEETPGEALLGAVAEIAARVAVAELAKPPSTESVIDEKSAHPMDVIVDDKEMAVPDAESSKPGIVLPSDFAAEQRAAIESARAARGDQTPLLVETPDLAALDAQAEARAPRRARRRPDPIAPSPSEGVRPRPRRARRRPLGVIIGGCMLVLAAILLAAWFAVGR